MGTTTGFNGRVATKLFPKTGNEMAGEGFKTLSNRNTLVPLEVVYGDGKTIEPGDTVWVRSDLGKSVGAPISVGGQELAIIDPQYIQLVTKAIDPVPAQPAIWPDWQLIPNHQYPNYPYPMPGYPNITYTAAPKTE